MSAIAGVYLLDGSPVDPDRLKRMNDRLSHRGPDCSGLWCEGSVGLGHQMLWTTPESLHEKLPLEADGLVITADARVDNREELLPELGLREDVSDSEVILETYRKWGRDCVDRLLGDFAFVVWDKAKGELFSARDHMGVKPFYYYHEPGKIFAFATEIKALFAWGVPREINEVRIGDYLTSMLEDREITFYENILRLPAASLLTVNKEKMATLKYWSLDPKREIKMGSDEEYERAFRGIFEEAVRCRLRSAFPIGSMLSGVMDSSSIVCMARELLPKDRRLKTFSIIYDHNKECDERNYINAVLKKGALESYFIHGDEIGPLNEIRKMLWHEDQPFYAPNLFLNWAIYKESREQKVRILLDGVDGDSSVSHGIAYITELTGKGKFFSALREVIGLSKRRKRSAWKILKTNSINPFIPENLRQARIRWRTDRGNSKKAGLANPIFAEKIDIAGRKKILQRERSKPSMTASEGHLRSLIWGGQQYFLEITNAASAAFSLESRYPFFDKRLMEFCLSLPGDQKIRSGWTRWILRSALKGILPEMIYFRGDKSDLSSNFLKCILKLNRDILDDLTSNKIELICMYVSASYLIEQYASQLRGQSDVKRTIDLFLSSVLALWLESDRADGTSYLCD